MRTHPLAFPMFAVALVRRAWFAQLGYMFHFSFLAFPASREPCAVGLSAATHNRCKHSSTRLRLLGASHLIAMSLLREQRR